jgi:hypothetical protein
MKAQEIQALENYFKTDNEHWNRYAFEMVCEVLNQNLFEQPELPLSMFSYAIDTFTELHESPLTAIKTFDDEIKKHKLTPQQKLFILEHVSKYVRKSEFDQEGIGKIKELLKSKVQKLSDEVNPNNTTPSASDMRETLKELFQQELAQLPEMLKTMEPAQRINTLCKMMPFVLHKVEAIHHEQSEWKNGDLNWFQDYLR